MFLKTIHIGNESLVTDIVLQDYRTGDIFRKYGIDYCCGGKLPLQTACTALNLDTEMIKTELNEAVRNISVSNSIDFRNWEIDFLIDYIIHVHHEYLTRNLPEIEQVLMRFA